MIGEGGLCRSWIATALKRLAMTILPLLRTLQPDPV
jgi:hypothetical protein